MRVVIQRVSEASVKVNQEITGAIKTGLLILVGIEDTDTAEDVSWICHKIIHMRIFNDENGVMNLSLQDVNGDILLISQFTLHAATKKGNRPSYIRASKPEKAIPIYETIISEMELLLQKKIQTGVFGADMKVHLLNDGPVTIFMDSKQKE